MEVAEDTEDVVFDGSGCGGEMGDEKMEGLFCHSGGRNAVGKGEGATFSEDLHDTLLLIARKRGEAGMQQDVVPAVDKRNVPRRIIEGETEQTCNTGGRKDPQVRNLGDRDGVDRTVCEKTVLDKNADALETGGWDGYS